MLGPTCNHDLGVLLRLYQPQQEHRSLSRQNCKVAIAAMLDAMGDHEHYCASYSTKDQPHVEGLLMTLSNSLVAKLKDMTCNIKTTLAQV